MYFEDTFGVLGVVILTVIFFAILFKLLDLLGIIGAKVTGLDPKSEKGNQRRNRIGFFFFGLFLIFAWFIAPMIGK